MNCSRIFLAVALLALCWDDAAAQQVLLGDPVHPDTGQAYPVMPGLPLLLPGDDGKFGTGDDVIDTGISGDVDLAVRSGTIATATVPPPSLAPGGPSIAVVTAGGGSTGLGAEAAFTVLLSDGSGSPPYGNVVTNSDMDLRPVTVYAFADLDGDGVLGPTNADGSADNAFELQEVTAYAGRQMGAFGSGRFQDSIGLEIGAPASMGGVVVGLVSGAYTGSTAEDLFTDGPLILTHWPLFPPLDPKDLLGGGNAPAPDPELANELEWNIEKNYLPAPGHALLGTPFAVAVDGSEPTTDQVQVESAAAVSARVFVEPVATKFLARARPHLRVAPTIAGDGRALVLPVGRGVLAADGAASQLVLRVLPVDLFGNVAEPDSPLEVVLTMSGSASIASPDADEDPKTEILLLDNAAGKTLVLDDDGSGNARLQLAIAGAPVQTLGIGIGAGADSDGDSVPDDGNDSGISGDRPCDDTTASCDDNCPRVLNPSQVDSNHDGIGDCCDGTCRLDPLSTGCDECALPAEPTYGLFSSAKLRVRLGGDRDTVVARLSFPLPPSASIAPDAETVALVATQVGSGGYSATLVSAFDDLLRRLPAFRYSDRTASVDGVVSARIKARNSGTWKLVLRARAPSLAELAPGNVDAALALGDDLVSGVLDCSGTATRLRCTLAP